MARAMRGLGWLLISAGLLVLLYLVYLLFFTNLKTGRAQESLGRAWEQQVGGLTAAPAPPEGATAPAPEPIDPGQAYAAIWFQRPGGPHLVRAEPLFVVEGVDPENLQLGPGHYPPSSAPGQRGNFGVSGHRTTYGAPFYHLDDLQPGDEIHVVDRQRHEWVYVVVRSQVVDPTEVWVLGPDPLGTGRPTMTMTTCNPRFSAAQRLVVFAELRTPQTGGPRPAVA